MRRPQAVVAVFGDRRERSLILNMPLQLQSARPGNARARVGTRGRRSRSISGHLAARARPMPEQTAGAPREAGRRPGLSVSQRTSRGQLARSDSWMISTRRVGSCSSSRISLGGQKACVDKFTEDFFGRFAVQIIEYREQLTPFAPGFFGGNEIAEEFPDNRNSLNPDAIDSCFGVLRQGAPDAADVLIRLADQETIVLVASFPKSIEAANANKGSAPRSPSTSVSISSTSASSSKR